MAWPCFRLDAGNTGASPHCTLRDAASLNPVTPETPVAVTLGGLVWGTPVIGASGVVYVGSTNKRVYAVDLAQGRILWKYRIFSRADSLIDSACSLSPDGAQLVVPGGDGFLHALDARTGRPQWVFRADAASDETHASGVIVNSFEGNVRHSPDGSRVYAGNDNAHLYCVDAATGALLWSFRTGMMIWTVPAFMSIDVELVVFGSLDGSVYAARSEDGARVAAFDTGGEVKASPVVRGADVFACNSNGRVLCLRLQAAGPTFAPVWSRSLGAEIYASPALSHGRLVLATMDGVLVCLSAADGAVLWRSALGAYSTASPVVTADGVVVAATSLGRLAAFDLASGDLLACLRVSDRNINASPAFLPDGSIAVGSYDGSLYRVTGAQLMNARDPLSDVTGTKTHLQPLAVGSGPVEFIHAFRLNAFDDQGNRIRNAAVTPARLRVTLLKTTDRPGVLPYEVALCPDGTTVNLLPLPDALEHGELRVKIAGTYYLKTTSWLGDRFAPGARGFFAQEFILPARMARREVQGPWLRDGITRYNVARMAVTQPTILDTYIPAAMDGQGFVAHVLPRSGRVESQAQGTHEFTAVFVPAIPDEEDGFEVLREPAKVLHLDGQARGDLLTLHARNAFTFSAMGGTMTFSRFTIYARVTEEGGLADIAFYARASCLNIKGNGESYKFSGDVVNQLCDRALDAHVVGTAAAFAMPVSTSTSTSTSTLITVYDAAADRVTSVLAQGADSLKSVLNPSTALVLADDACVHLDLTAASAVKPNRDLSKTSQGDGVPSTDAWFVRRVFPPLINAACDAGLHPNVVTVSSMATTLAMPWVAARFRGAAVWAVPALMMYKWFADAIDGPIARGCDATSALGGLLDFAADSLFVAVSYVVFCQAVRRPLSARVFVEAATAALLPWLVIATLYGPRALIEHGDFKNNDNIVNTVMYFLVENTFVLILVQAAVYAALVAKAQKS